MKEEINFKNFQFSLSNINEKCVKQTRNTKVTVLQKHFENLEKTFAQRDNHPCWQIYNTNNNNNNPDDETDVTSNDKVNTGGEVSREYLISDDEEDKVNQANLSVDKTFSIKQSLTNASSPENMNNTSSKSDDSKSNDVTRGCEGLYKHSMKSLPSFVLITIYDVSTKLMSMFFHFIYVIFLSLYGWLRNFTKEENLWQMIKAFPMTLIEKLYCFCSLNECRRINARTFLSLHARNVCNEDDTVITKCTWPLWVFGIAVLLVFIFGCHYANPQASMSEKYEIGIKYFKDLLNIFVFNLYNLPGYECMASDNCCASKLVATKRWLYCFFTLPYRTSLIGITTRMGKLGSLEENLQNITDWKLKRNLQRLKTLITELNSKVYIISRKTAQTEKLLDTLKVVATKNLTRISNLVYDEEQLDAENEENLKRFEDLSVKVNSLTDMKASMDKTVSDMKKCSKCSIKKLSRDLETFTKNELNSIDELGKRIRDVEAKSQEKLKYTSTNKVFEDLKKEILCIQNGNTKWSAKLANYETFPLKFQSDIDILNNYISDRVASEMTRITQKNLDLLDRFNKLVALNLQKISLFLPQQKITLTQLIRSVFGVHYQKIKHDIVEEFCPKVKEYVRMTVLSSMTLSNTVQSCGFVSRITFSNEECLLNHFKEIDKNYRHSSCCRTKSDIYQRLNETFAIFSADNTGLADYASVRNGGQILESYTTPSFYYKESEGNYEISHFSSNPWSQLFFFPKHFVNSVNLLNSGHIQLGRCWQFKGQHGSTIIRLAQIIIVKFITLDHIHPSLSLNQSFDDAPKEFNLHALINEVDSTGILLGTFNFDELFQNPTQQFEIQEHIQTQFLKFTVISNHGAGVTCVYRLRIHGSLLVNSNEKTEA